MGVQIANVSFFGIPIAGIPLGSVLAARVRISGINERGLEVILCGQIRVQLLQVIELHDASGAAHDLPAAFGILRVHGQKLDHIAHQIQQVGVLPDLGIVFCLFLLSGHQVGLDQYRSHTALQ